MSKSINDPLVWIDCEMTGLELGVDELCEVAVIVTDFNLEPAGEGIDLIIKPSQAALDNMGEFVTKMHTDSGLLAALDEGMSVEQAQEDILEYLKQYVPQPRLAPLAGNSVGTDKTFLAAQMPQLVDFLHYRVVDVSSIKELARRWFPRTYFAAPEKHGGHRALADILESIQELRYYREVLFPQGEGPSSQQCLQAAADLAQRYPLPSQG